MPITIVVVAVLLFNLISSKNKEIPNSFASIKNLVYENIEPINKRVIPSPSPIVKRETKVKVAPTKVLLLIYNPKLENQKNQKLTEYKNWNNPVTLTQNFIASVNSASSGQLKYQIVSTIEIDKIPTKASGFTFTDESYLTCIENTSTCPSLDLADYLKMISDSDACTKRNNNEIDELWIWGGPYFGYWESNLAGPSAFWYNSMPTFGTNCNTLLPIMGFNYERGEAEMFEDLAHRLESTMTKVYGSWQANDSNPWNKFSLLDYDAQGKGGCGNAHLAVNASNNTGYDRTNTRTVKSSCDDFYNYPNLKGTTVDINCTAWKCDTLQYFKWWFSHLPKADGKTNGKLNNWWLYIKNPTLAL